MLSVMITSGDYVVLPVNHVISRNTLESGKIIEKEKEKYTVFCVVFPFNR